MAGVRLTGLASGLDTESLVKQLSQAYQIKVDDAKKKQTKAEWKKEAWGNLNTKLMNFYKNALTTFKSTSTYKSKTVIGTLSGVKITAGSNAVNGNHKVKVEKTASAQMWTGHQINVDADGNAKKYTSTSYKAAKWDDVKDTKISELYDKNGYPIMSSLNGSSFTVQPVSGESKDVTISVNENTTIEDLLTSVNEQLEGTGLTAGFENGALTFTNTTATELENDTGDTTYTGGTEIIITARDQASAKALGLTYNENGKGTVVDPLSDKVTNNTVKGSAFAYDKVETEGSSVTGSSKLMDLGIADGTSIKVNGTEIVVDRTTTLDSLAKSMSDAGINASYDAKQGRFYLSSKETGTASAFTVEADGETTLAALGLDLADGESGKIAASDAIIEYNGVTYKSNNNTFDINGLTFEVSEANSELQQSFTVEADVNGIYEKVKNFVKEYNELITEMNKLYNADSSKGYEPLTSDEKDAMNDEDIENWEKKIKDSLLRRDSTIDGLLSFMRTALNKSVEVKNADGTTSRFSLSSFGIVTGTWTERGLLHINGNSDDPDYADFEDKLKKMISANPDAVAQTFASLGNDIYSYMQKKMKSTEFSSALTFYEDKRMDGEIKDYKDEVKAMQKKMADEEERYYKQFSAMETALAKLQSQQTYIAQLFGGR